ncbi:type II toxin-antitoxin system HicA family toxin, partial [Bacteroides acidifaciens]
ELTAAGCYVLRHGANHDIWYSPKTGNKFALSRHGKQEVPTGMERKARKVLLGE